MWAVGFSQGPSELFSRGLIEHWNGRRWSIVRAPNPETYNELFGISARSASDVWAVGRSYDSGQPRHNLVLHWDGSSWARVQAPSPSPTFNNLASVSAVRRNDAWAVGYAGDATRRPLTLHWNGSSWSVVPGPPLSGQLQSVAAARNGRAWAAGYRGNGVGTLIERWNGSAWTVVESQDPRGATFAILAGIAVRGGVSGAWAVGATAGPPDWREHTLVERPHR